LSVIGSPEASGVRADIVVECSIDLRRWCLDFRNLCIADAAALSSELIGHSNSWPNADPLNAIGARPLVRQKLTELLLGGDDDT